MKLKRIIFAVLGMVVLICSPAGETKDLSVAGSISEKNQIANLIVEAEPEPAQTATLETTLDNILRQSGYAYGKVKQNSWYINIRGKELTNIRILLGAGSSSIAVGAVVAPKQKLVVNADSMFKMMKLSYDLNYVRVCIDPDDDLLVMAQVKGRSIDLEEFKDVVDRVAAAADRAYVEIRPFLKP